MKTAIIGVGSCREERIHNGDIAYSAGECERGDTVCIGFDNIHVFGDEGGHDICSLIADGDEERSDSKLSFKVWVCCCLSC